LSDEINSTVDRVDGSLQGRVALTFKLAGSRHDPFMSLSQDRMQQIWIFICSVP
jgi:hypothetical protein